MKAECETLKIRLSINKRTPSSPTKIQTNRTGEPIHEANRLADLIEDKFNIIQNNVTKLINEKFSSLKKSGNEKVKLTPASYAAAVGENRNANSVELRNIMAATRNEEKAEQTAQKKRANNLVIHGRN